MQYFTAIDNNTGVSQSIIVMSWANRNKQNAKNLTNQWTVTKCTHEIYKQNRSLYSNILQTCYSYQCSQMTSLVTCTITLLHYVSVKLCNEALAIFILLRCDRRQLTRLMLNTSMVWRWCMLDRLWTNAISYTNMGN